MVPFSQNLVRYTKNRKLDKRSVMNLRMSLSDQGPSLEEQLKDKVPKQLACIFQESLTSIRFLWNQGVLSEEHALDAMSRLNAQIQCELDK